jgi:hypothetical protein
MNGAFIDCKANQHNPVHSYLTSNKSLMKVNHSSLMFFWLGKMFSLEWSTWKAWFTWVQFNTDLFTDTQKYLYTEEWLDAILV